MLRLTELAHQACRQVLSSGDIAIDATVGNGHDTQFLAECVGETGWVYGFDIQIEALERTRRRLVEIQARNVQLFQESHAELKRCIPEEFHGHVKVVMFNLGYLPGGDKEITTETPSSLLAIEQACELLHPEGLISVIAYPGHPAGAQETEAVSSSLETRGLNGWSLQRTRSNSQQSHSPQFFLLSPY